MGDPIRKLHEALVAENYLSGEDTNFEQFQTKMADPGDRRELYGFLTQHAPDIIGDVTFDEFDRDFDPSGAKKKSGSDVSGTSSSSPTAAPTAAGSTQTTEFTDPFGREARGPVAQESPQAPAPSPAVDPLDPFARSPVGPVPVKRDPNAPPSLLTGNEDPLAVGGQLRRLVEPDYEAMDARAGKYAWRKGQRDLEKISMYGQQAQMQASAANALMARRLGPDWQNEFAKYSQIVEPMLNGQEKPSNAADASYIQEAMEFYTQVKNDPDFQMWSDGQNALLKAQQAFNEYGKRNPEYAKQLAENAALTKVADQHPGTAIQNWVGQKATQLIAGIASLPRTAFGSYGVLPGSEVLKNTPLNDVAQSLGDWADHAVEWATRVSPTGSGTNRPLWQRSAPFEGLDVVVDDKGQATTAYKDGNAVEMTPEQIRRFQESGVAQTASKSFTGTNNAAYKLASVVSDLYLMRAMGGGTLAGTTAVAFTLQHRDAYETALNDLKLNADDAAKYAMISAGLSALIEASFGKIETAPLKLQVAKNIGLSEAKALVGKASIYDIAKAAWKPLAREIGMENVEELVDNASQTLNNQVFNAMTGSNLDTQMRPEDAAETILLTTLTTGLAGGGDAMRHGRSQLNTLALNAAVQNPEAYQKVLAQLQQGGVISEAQVAEQTNRISYLAQVNGALPTNITEDARQEVIDLSDQRLAAEARMAAAPAGALKEAAKKEVKDIDARVTSLVARVGKVEEKAAEEAPQAAVAQPVVEQEQPVVVADENGVPAAPTEQAPVPEQTVTEMPAAPVMEAPAPEIVAEQPVAEEVPTPKMIELFNRGRADSDVTPFDTLPTKDMLGDNRLVPVAERGDAPTLNDVLVNRDVTIGQVATSYQNQAHNEVLLDDVTNLALNSLMPAQVKALGEGVPGLRDFLADHLQDDSWVRSMNDQPFQRAIERLSEEYVRENTTLQPRPEAVLSRRLTPVTVEDYIAQRFAEGVRVRMTDIQGDVREARKDGGMRLQYTSRNGTPLDLLAQDIMESMGKDGDTMASSDVMDEIRSFIHENPKGPGEYLRSTIAERERTDMGQEMADLGYSEADTQQAMEKALDVESQLTPAEQIELVDFIDTYADNPDQLIEDWNAWDPFENPDSPISGLSKNVYDVVNQQLKAIQDDQQGRLQVADQTVRTSETQGAESAGISDQPGQDGNTDVASVRETPSDAGTETKRVVKDSLTATLPSQMERILAEVDEQLAQAELPDALTADLVRELRVDGHIDAADHAAILDYLAGDENDRTKAAYEKGLAALPGLREVKSEAVSGRERLAEDGPERMPAPVVSRMSDGQALIENAAGFADLLASAGGKYDASLNGWLFPADQDVNALLGSRRTDGSSIAQAIDKSKMDTGFFGRAKNLLTSPGGLLKAYRTRTRLAAAKTLTERLAVAQQQHQISRSKDQAVVRRTLKRLQKAFPNIESVTDIQTIDRVKKEQGLTGPILGFQFDGKVYTDPRVAAPTTPIHEFGHIWNPWLKENDPPMYERGAELARESDLYEQVKNNPKYDTLDDAGIVDEVLATAIGESGALIGDTALTLRFKLWLHDMWSSVQRSFGFQPKFMSLKEFADYQAMRMLAEKPIMKETSQRISALETGIQDIRAQYGGEKGATGAVLANLDTAWQMEEQGIDDEKIFHATGWFRGVDGMWRWGIDSSTLRIKVAPDPSLGSAPLGDLVDYPSLFGAYPSLSSARVIFRDEMASGHAGVIDGDIAMSHETFFGISGQKILVHEIQHLIQAEEGFARGASPRSVVSIMDNEMDSIARDFMSNPEDMSPEEADFLAKRQARAERYSLRPWEGYYKSAGEVEARAAEAQQGFNLKAYAPNLYDVAPEEQIVMFHDGEQYHLAPPRLQVDMSAADYVSRADTAREIIRLEIRDNGLKNLDAKARQISEAMNLDLTHVRRIYESEIADAQMGKLVLTRNEIGVPEETMRQRLLRHYGLKVKSAGDFMRRKFSTTRGLPKEIFDVDEKRLGKVAARLKPGEYLIHDLERAMKSTYGKALSDAQWQHVDNVIRGEGDWATLPPDVRAGAQALREYTDSLSRELVRSGVMNGEVILTVLNNSGLQTTQDELESYQGVNLHKALGKLPFERSSEEHAAIDYFLSQQQNTVGNYLYRSYRKHDLGAEWIEKVSPRVMSEARAFLAANIQREIDNLEQARTDKSEVLQENIDGIQATIDSILAGIEAEVQVLQDKKAGLAAKRRDAAAAGNGTKNIERSYGAADKALRKLAKRAREARSVALDDASDLLELEGADYQALSVAAKRIIKMRQQINDLKDRQVAAAEYRQETMDSMLDTQQNIDGLIERILYVEDGPSGQLSNSRLGAKDLKILKAREDIAPEIRALMGEYHDPRVNFAKSMYRMVNLLENQKFLVNLRERFAGQYFIPGDQVRKGFVPISSEGSQTMSPLNGWQTTPEILRAINGYFGKTAKGDDLPSILYQNFIKFVSMVKYGKTILSPVTHFRNFFGNIFFMINNGYNPLKKKSFLAFRDAWFNNLNQDERGYMNDLTELRILNNGAYLGAIKELLHTMNPDTAQEFFRNRISEGFGKARRGIEDTYGAEDDFYRIIAFENEKGRYAKRWYGRKFEELSLAEQKAVKQKAADIVINTLPTYSMVPEIVRDLQKFPLTGTFVAFPAEMFRVTINQYKLILSDMKDPRTQSLGVQRLIGASIAQVGLSVALSVVGHWLAGIDWDEDKAARKFMLPWQADGVLTYTDFEPGKEYRFINTAYTDPYSFIKKPVLSFLRNDDKGWADRFSEAAYKLVEPFFSPELTAGTLGQLYYNIDERNQKPIYSPALGPIGDLGETVNFLRWSLQPGVFKTAQDFASAATQTPIGGRAPKQMSDVLSGFVGLQVERVQLEKAVASDLFKKSKQKIDARAIFTLKKFDLKGDKDALNARYDMAEREYNTVLRETGESLRAARILGLDPAKQRDMLKKGEFSEQERAAIMNNRQIKPTFEGFKR